MSENASGTGQIRDSDRETALDTLRHLSRDAVSEDVQLQAATQLLWTTEEKSDGVQPDIIDEIAEKVVQRLRGIAIPVQT